MHEDQDFRAKVAGNGAIQIGHQRMIVAGCDPFNDDHAARAARGLDQSDNFLQQARLFARAYHVFSMLCRNRIRGGQSAQGACKVDRTVGVAGIKSGVGDRFGEADLESFPLVGPDQTECR